MFRVKTSSLLWESSYFPVGGLQLRLRYVSWVSVEASAAPAAESCQSYTATTNQRGVGQGHMPGGHSHQATILAQLRNPEECVMKQNSEITLHGL